MKKKHVVCLGGGIGTMNLVKGLKDKGYNLTVVASMADDGGSSGRLRRLFNIQPPGDLVSCMAALSEYSDQLEGKLLTYRFPGDRYGKDDTIGGQKLGNLMMVAAQDLTGSYNGAVALLKHLFKVRASIYPATLEPVSISATTIDGIRVEGEENIDLGKYEGQRVLEKITLEPEHPKVAKEVIKAISKADLIIAGPGDLYTTILPAIIIPDILDALKQSKARKIFVVNVANKPFETRGYAVADFINAIAKHLAGFPFDTVITNNNVTIEIPDNLNYTYVENTSGDTAASGYKIIEDDLVDDGFPIYHDHKKLANVIAKEMQGS
jgi:uncharacterized cofD-like protein